ncbi:uncharacterized protein [Halyomorpha halys]|uniref:uncharacterized protein n=1 Tax=Halyomorpha halys TaxID=286706 RepID=UPI0006D4D718|nr:myoneurin [Halyomorpha halys]
MDFQYDNSSRLDWMLKLIELKNSRTFCDIIINKGNSLVYAHSCILAAFSPFMLELLRSFSQSDWSVFKPLKINLTYVTKCKKNSDMNCIGCVGKVIDYLYTGKILVEYPHVPHLINLSKNMELLSLMSVCQKFLSLEKSTDSKIPSVQKVEQDNSSKDCDAVSLNSKNILNFDQLCLDENRVVNKTKSCHKNIVEKTAVTANYGSEVKSSIVNKKLFNFDVDTFSHKSLDNKSNNNSVLSDERGGEYNCTKCKLRFNCFKMFEAHKKVFHKRQFICLSCNFTTFKLSYIVYHLINMNHEESCCSVCLFKAKDSSGLKVHLQDHKNDFPFKCYECGNLFKARTAWLRHIFLHNSEDKPHSSQVCEVCGFVAPYESVLERHCLKHSKVNKTFTCPVIPCSFSTYSKYNLKQHMFTHENDKYFICKVCSLKFSQEKNLKRHIQTLHEPKIEPYQCFRCDYRSARIDKMKGHCNSLHPGDEEAINSILKQHKEKKSVCTNNNKEESKKNVDVESKTDDTPKLIGQKLGNCTASVEDSKQITNQKMDLTSVNDCNKKNTFILSETTGEFNIISENEGEKIPVASVTSKNVLTIGNFREGTGSVTLNETTGILTFNNINSESTGAVFLNESTGELSYINLNKDSISMDVEKPEPKYCREVRTQLNEFTGEIFTVDNERKLQDLNDEDSLFDTFDMDIGNEDSCDGFDDLDGLLFDPIDIEGTDHIDLFISKNDTGSLKNIPHLNEATGELSFDMESQNSNVNIWSSNHSFHEEETEDPYRLLLNEVTGEFS